MFNPFKRKKKEAAADHVRRGIPTAEVVPRVASTVTTRIVESTPIPPPPATSPPLPPQPIPLPPQAVPIPSGQAIVEPEPLSEPEPEIEPALPGPDVLPAHTAEADAKFAGKTAEELCDVDASIPVEEMRKRLAELFTRHNRAASSFDLELRAEAEIMLRAIVTLREKYVELL
jgi:hypothetical protein